MGGEPDGEGTHPDREYQLDSILALVSQLYEVYYKGYNDVTQHRLDTEMALCYLMEAWNAFLG